MKEGKGSKKGEEGVGWEARGGGGGGGGGREEGEGVEREKYLLLFKH